MDNIKKIITELDKENENYIYVKNMHSGNIQIPGGALNKWMEYKGYSKSVYVQCARCRKSEAKHGGHVIKYGSEESKERYIVPLCISCNEKKDETPFRVQKSVLVRASELV